MSRNHPREDQTWQLKPTARVALLPISHGRIPAGVAAQTHTSFLKYFHETPEAFVEGGAHEVTKRTAELAVDSKGSQAAEVEEETLDHLELDLAQEEECGLREKEEQRKEEEEEDHTEAHSSHDTITSPSHDTITSPSHTLDTDTAIFADELELAAWTALPPSPTLKKHRLKKRPLQSTSSPTPPLTITAETMPPTQPIPLLICSIGNPGSAYANTLHSAGHTLLASLASLIQHPPFTKDRNGAVSTPSYSSQFPSWTLFQSGAYMNESGKPIAKAYTSWSRTLDRDVAGLAKVVVIHDELEKPLGKVSVREGQGLSAKGHNGIKSLLQTMGRTGFVRVGVGIGRPAGRGSEEVAKYVLGKMTAGEKNKVQEAAGEVMERLRVLGGC